MMPNWMSKAKEILIYDEGITYEPYKDTKGYWTIGVGYLIGNDLENLRLSWSVIQKMLEEKIEESLEALYDIFTDDFDSFAVPRQLALLGMIYSLGKPKFMGFTRMIDAINGGNWEQAALECKNSKWAHDVDPHDIAGQGRDDRTAYMLRTGRLHLDYEADT